MTPRELIEAGELAVAKFRIVAQMIYSTRDNLRTLAGEVIRTQAAGETTPEKTAGEIRRLIYQAQVLVLVKDRILEEVQEVHTKLDTLHKQGRPTINPSTINVPDHLPEEL